MSKPKYRIEIEKENLISNSEILNNYVNESLFKIIWLNEPLISVGEVFNNIKDVKRKYHGQGYIYYPIDVNNDGNIEITNEDNKRGYMIISKREFKLKYKYLLYTKSKELFEHIHNNDVIRFLTDVNMIIHGRSYICKIFSNNDVLIHEFKNIFANDSGDLKIEILDRLNSYDEELYALIANIELPVDSKYD